MIDPKNNHQQMLGLYHPPLNCFSFKKKYLAGTKYTIDAKVISKNKNDTTHNPTNFESVSHVNIADDHPNSNMEGLLEMSFTEAARHACICVVQCLQLDRVDRVEYNTDYRPCSFLSELLEGTDPNQKKTLRSCHIYTKQWLLERDLSWWSGNLSVTKLMPWTECGSTTSEPELVKAVGAWSTDLQGDCANEILSSTGKVDTIPCDNHSLIDAKSLTPGRDEDTCTHSDTSIRKPSSTNLSSEVNVLVGFSVSCDVDKSNLMEVGKSSPSSDDSSETTSDSDLTLVEEQAEELLPFIIKTILARLLCDKSFIQTPGMSSGSRNSTRADNTTLTFDGHTNGHNINDRKRKRGQHDDDNDNENDSGNEQGPPALRLPNSMPLQDPTAKLACHFYILHPDKYSDGPISGKTYKTCPMGFKDSKDLRDHHKKKHCGPKFLCSRCHTEFQTAADKAAHENLDERCERKENTTFRRERYILVGTSRRAQFDNMKKPRNHSHEEHWFEVWKILFPGYQPPTSPYVPVYGFAAQIDRIAEEVIQTHVFARNQMTTAIDNQTAASFLRLLARRLRERILEEIQGGRFNDVRSILGGSPRPMEDHRSSIINSARSTHGTLARDHLSVSLANSFPPQPVNYPVNQVTVPFSYEPQPPFNYQATFGHLYNSQNSVVSSQGNNSSSTYSGSAGLTQVPFSDLHNLQTDLNNHNYDSV